MERGIGQGITMGSGIHNIIKVGRIYHIKNLKADDIKFRRTLQNDQFAVQLSVYVTLASLPRVQTSIHAFTGWSQQGVLLTECRIATVQHTAVDDLSV